ncbi:MAG: helix-turn-helix domain-containing protein, partial [Planctomycetota bacterium]
FRARLHAADVLVCEDLQAIEGRRPVQSFLIGWIDETLAYGGRGVLTSTKSPGEFDRFDARLTSRCHGGLCVGIGLPGTTSRAALLGHFASLRGLSMPSDQTQRLAERLCVSPRELSGAVARLDVLAADLGLTVVNAAIVDRFFGEEVERRPIDIARIARATANHFDLSVSHLRTGGRHAATVVPRQVAMMLARDLTDEPLEKIAVYFGRKNHGTVIHAARRMRARLEEDAAMRRHVAEIRRGLGLTPKHVGMEIAPG